MTLLSSLSAGTTGLSASSAELSVIGDNIANANTVGYKEGRVAFADALAQNLVGGSGQIGLGARVQAVQKIITQGALSNTGNATDLGLQGSGFFAVSGTNSDGRQGTFLTRAGQFTLDSEGYLVNLAGLRVQGYQGDPAGNITSNQGDLLIGNATAAPRATRTVTIRANLQADAPVPAAWDPANPAGTSSFSTSLTLYDSLGQAYQAPVYFRNNGNGQWEYHVMIDGASVTGGMAGTPVPIADGTLQFDTDGRLASAPPPMVSFNPLNATQGQVFDINVGDPIDAGGTGLAGITQFAGASATTFIGQDGYSSGQVSSVQVDKNGVINGVFTNGQTRPLGQVGVARVAAADQLERVGGNLFSVTRGSGEAVLGAAGTGGRAFISAGTLEQSNVDIAEQFVRMISAQRNFEANSKTITTADQLLSELISLKR